MNKSYLKYAGSKSRIIDAVVYAIGKVNGRLVEPFVGSATVALNVEAPSYLLNDINSDVINCHKKVASVPDLVLTQMGSLYEGGREGYYDVRTEFNNRTMDPVKSAAAFIYMNKHGFNGMCRYNSRGAFNIPVGKGKTIHNPADEIMNFGKVLGWATFINTSFEKVFEELIEGDVVYCDPPYVPSSVTMSDINYTGEGFSFEQQQQLVKLSEEASNKGIRCVISNHDTPITRELYKNADEIMEIEVFRSISSGKRGAVKELIAIYEGKIHG